MLRENGTTVVRSDAKTHRRSMAVLTLIENIDTLLRSGTTVAKGNARTHRCQWLCYPCIMSCTIITNDPEVLSQLLVVIYSRHRWLGKRDTVC